VLPRFPQKSLLLAVEAVRAGERLQGVLMAAPEQSLREALASMGGVLLVRSTSAVGISPDNQWLVTGGVDGTVRLWDLTAKDPAANPVVLRGHRSAVTAAEISSNNHWLVTGSADATARLWDREAKDPAADPIVLRDHEDQGAVTAVGISQDNHWLVTGSTDGTVRLWESDGQRSCG
jgi:WD40 repeat protein